jgi:hypothetical protein
MSYRESAAARRRIKALEAELDLFRNARGTLIGTSDIADDAAVAMRTAKKLGHAIVVEEYQGSVNVYAVKRGDRA